MVMNIFVLFFHNRARSLAYQVMKMWKKSCLLAAQAHHRQTNGYRDRQKCNLK